MPRDAFTAETLGTERAGHGVLIRESGLVLTIGYLITEADQIWLHLADGRAVAGTVIGFDPVSGFGLVQALGRVDLPVMPLGDSAAVELGDKVVIGGGQGAMPGARVQARIGRIVPVQTAAAAPVAAPVNGEASFSGR